MNMMHTSHKSIDEVIERYRAITDHLRESLSKSKNNETVNMKHANHSITNNSSLQKNHLIGSGGENLYVITSGNEELDIDDLPISEVIIYEDSNKKNRLKDTLDLRHLVQQVRDDLSFEPISKVIRDKNDLLINLSISATGLKEDIITVRLNSAFINNWYKELQIIIKNAPMIIGDNLDLNPLPLMFHEEINIVTPQDVEENSELIISKEAGKYTILHSGYDLMITNVFNADIETNKLCTIWFKDYFYNEREMETLSIKFNDKKILLSNVKDQIYSSESFSDKLNDHIKSMVIPAPLEATSSNHSNRRKRLNDLTVQNYYIDQPEIATSNVARPSSWISDLLGWVESFIGGLLGSKLERTSSYTNSISLVHSPLHVTGTMVLEVLIRKRTGQKYISSVDYQISLMEAQGYGINITQVFEEVAEEAALKSGVLNINSIEIQKEITKKIISGKFDEISRVLKSHIEKACSGRMNSKKFDMFMIKFNSRLNSVLIQQMQQILHNRNSTFEVSYEKGQKMNFGPQSCLIDTSVQGHFTQALIS